MTFVTHYEDLIDGVTALRVARAAPADVAAIYVEGQAAKDAVRLAADIDEARVIAEAYAANART
jgi:succinyl-CoA synthetase alpha subunit